MNFLFLGTKDYSLPKIADTPTSLLIEILVKE